MGVEPSLLCDGSLGALTRRGYWDGTDRLKQLEQDGRFSFTVLQLRKCRNFIFGWVTLTLSEIEFFLTINPIKLTNPARPS